MIQEISAFLGGVPESAVWALLAFSGVALIAQVVALVDLARREAVMWDRKWVWVLIILLLNNGLGALLWFVLGRRVPQPSDQVAQSVETAPGSASDAQGAVDVLYGDGDKEGRS